MDLILGMGAEHTKPQRLNQILRTIVNDNKSEYWTHNRMLNYISNLNIVNNNDLLYYHANNMIFPNIDKYVVEEKYDGFSYLCVDGDFYSKRLSTAKGNEGMPVCKSGHIPHLTNVMKKASLLCNCNFDLHGEIYIENGISDDVTKILGCTEDKAVDRLSKIRSIKKMPRYMLIDIRSFNGVSLINESQRIRRVILEYVYNRHIKPNDPYDYVQLAEQLTGNPIDRFNNIVKYGGEGIVIKDGDGIYIPGKKPANNWIKCKKKITHDVFITGFKKGTGKNADMFGSIEFGHLVDGEVVKCGYCSSGLSDAVRENIHKFADEMIENKQVFEIEAIQESVKSFRNPVFLRFRNDKAWSECQHDDVRIQEMSFRQLLEE